MESSTTSSRTHFEVLGLGLDSKVLDLDSKVLGLGLQAYKSSKMPCLRSRTALFLDLYKWAKVMTFFFLRLGERARNLAVNLRRPFFFGKHLRVVSLALASSIPVLGLERVGPWPRIVLCPWPRPRALCLRLLLAIISLTFT